MRHEIGREKSLNGIVSAEMAKGEMTIAIGAEA